MSENQYADLIATMAKQRYPDKPFGKMIDQWDQQFFKLLETRSQAGFDSRLQGYVDQRRQAFRDRNREARPHNIKLWEDYALRTLSSLDDDQHEFVVNWLAKLSVTLTSLAKDKPSYTAASAMDFRCKGGELSG